ncbi:MAG: polyisoprenoid-binding protein [Arcicella sp.]|nr:polyisoprenoid-binding protein [Arcicella sp.]
MKKNIIIIVYSVLLSLNIYGQTSLPLKSYKVDKSHTNIGFTISHFVISDVLGSFKDFEGTFIYSKNDFSDAKVKLTIKASSIETNDVNRDNHLKTADFFDVAKYPTITFESQSVKLLKGKNISIKGSITINGVTKPITLSGIYKGEFINPMTKNTIAVFQITTDIVRKDFNIGLSYPTAALGDVVKLESTVELIKE